ncbi:HIT domain-containing protein [Nesterenkonia sp. HG001]|uniref:HIT family protein n=1 Tax=Nesterenkonia sp. HG001 TaxID=2983207 RepID=UPI002AC63CE8|nr:HIT domain-containing protein [Nesterenkonia sp. HG001]MDZ5078417.1 HIT domain-containing protein [Nesterenkonia sp. HG001]
MDQERDVAGGADAETDDFPLAGVPDAFQRLWNPHRIAYMRRGQDQVSGAEDCPFCAGPRRSDDESLIVHRGHHCYVLLNLYPYNPGHLLVCPYRHVPDLTDLTLAESQEFIRLSQVAMVALRTVAAPGGFNLGLNQGKDGGAGISAHLHQHVVPRWGGDGNFLPIIAQTKNMAQTLGETHRMLHDVWDDAARSFAEQQARSERDPRARVEEGEA